MEKRCENCCHWQRMESGESFENDGTMFNEDGTPEIGRCQRFPPFIVSDLLASARRLPLYADRNFCGVPPALVQSATAWPVTWDCDSCGEFKDN